MPGRGKGGVWDAEYSQEWMCYRRKIKEEMSRSAEEVLEFDKLRELLRLRTTCAPGRRAVDALGFSVDRAALELAFAQIREAREWLRAERELGFGGLADPETWLAQIEGPAAATWLAIGFRNVTIDGRAGGINHRRLGMRSYVLTQVGSWVDA